MTEKLPRPASSPCGSCPYRCDVPLGLWAREEYDKLPEYDGETFRQSPNLFMCHQRDGNLCAGWLTCHDADHLLALWVNRVDPSAFGYRSPVPVFGSGREARRHGIAEIAKPKQRAQKMIKGLEKKREEL